MTFNPSTVFILISFFVLLSCYVLSIKLFRDSEDYPSKSSLWSSFSSSTPQLSGFYKPSNITREDFAGAFLIHKNKILNDPNIMLKWKEIHRRGIELALFAILNSGVTLMSRDYYDFQVVHLSATLNQVPNINNVGIQNELLFRMTKTIDAYRQHQTTKIMTKNVIKDRKKRNFKIQDIGNSTIAMIPYTTLPGTLTIDNNTDIIQFNNELRLLFLEATILSIIQYFPNIMIFLRSSEDLAIVKARMIEIDLPIWKYVDLSNIATDPTLLPKWSLMYVHDRLKNAKDDIRWANIDYIYYTEMDQLLHLRAMRQMFKVIDRMNETVTFVPHRLQTIALPLTFPASYHLWRQSWHPSRLEALDKVKIIIEDSVIPHGSCCDDGRFKFRDCGNWWYNCKTYGVHNYTTWIRYGEHGFTMPLGTEHQAKCRYSKERIICPRPVSCARRIPRNIVDVCDEMPIVVNIPSLAS